MAKLNVVTTTNAAEVRQAMFQEWLQKHLPTLKQAYEQGEVEHMLYQAWRAGFFSGRSDAVADWADHMRRMAQAMESSAAQKSDRP